MALCTELNQYIKLYKINIMNNWTSTEEQVLMNYVEASDRETTKERIEFANYMMYSKDEGGHPDLIERTVSACVSRYYKVCNERNN